MLPNGDSYHSHHKTSSQGTGVAGRLLKQYGLERWLLSCGRCRFGTRGCVVLLVITVLMMLLLTSSQSQPWLPFRQSDTSEVCRLLAGPEQPERRLPQALIIGVRKCGTRALLEFLDNHSHIQAVHREVHFFDRDENYQQGLDWYRSRMVRSYKGQITIEKSPGYFIAEAAAMRARHMNSSLRLILVVRDPVERMVSDYTQLLSYHQEEHNGSDSETKDFPSFEEQALDSKGQPNMDYKALRISVYRVHLARWLKHFNMSQILVLDGERLVSQPLKELAKVEHFLGLPPELNENMFYFNTTRGFYCMKRNASGGGHCLAQSKGRRHPSVNAKVIHRLRTYFRPHNQRFYNITGIDFGWS